MSHVNRFMDRHSALDFYRYMQQGARRYQLRIQAHTQKSDKLFHLKNRIGDFIAQGHKDFEKYLPVLDLEWRQLVDQSGLQRVFRQEMAYLLESMIRRLDFKRLGMNPETEMMANAKEFQSISRSIEVGILEKTITGVFESLRNFRFA